MIIAPIWGLIFNKPPSLPGTSTQTVSYRNFHPKFISFNALRVWCLHLKNIIDIAVVFQNVTSLDSHLLKPVHPPQDTIFKQLNSSLNFMYPRSLSKTTAPSLGSPVTRILCLSLWRPRGSEIIRAIQREQTAPWSKIPVHRPHCRIPSRATKLRGSLPKPNRFFRNGPPNFPASREAPSAPTKCLNKVGMHVGHGEARRTSHFPDLRAGSDSTMVHRTGDAGIKFCRLHLHRRRSPSSSFDRGIGYIPSNIKALSNHCPRTPRESNGRRWPSICIPSYVCLLVMDVSSGKDDRNSSCFSWKGDRES